MRILHIISQKPDSTGSGIYLQNLIRQSEKNNHENALLAGIPPDYTDEEGITGNLLCDFVNFEGNDLPFRITGMSDVMPYPSSKFSELSNAEIELYMRVFSAKLKKIADTFRPDIIHSHHLWILTAIATKVLPQVPIVTSCHGSDLRQFQRNNHLREMVKNGCQRLSAVFALTKDQADEIESMYKIEHRKIHLIGSAYNDKIFYQGKPKVTGAKIKILYAGKLSQSKGVPFLIKAFSEIRDQNLELHLVGSGSGSEAELCSALASSDKRVVLHGAITQYRLADLLRQSHIFVLPSLYEGLPLVILEALACSCRIIATELPGIKQIFNTCSGNSLPEFISLIPLPQLFDIDNIKEESIPMFTENLKTMILKQVQASGINDVSFRDQAMKILTPYRWESIFTNIETVYKNVLALKHS